MADHRDFVLSVLLCFSSLPYDCLVWTASSHGRGGQTDFVFVYQTLSEFSFRRVYIVFSSSFLSFETPRSIGWN